MVINRSSSLFNFIIFIFLTTAFGCSQKVVHFVNSNARFSSYTSYDIVNFKTSKADISQEGQAIFRAIESNIASQLQRRDYQKKSEKPDIVARYELISNQRTEVNRNYSPYYFPTYGNNYYTTRTFLESALLIELFDANSKKLVWQASLDLNKYAKRNNKEEILKDAISQLFNTYLYRANSNTPDESLIIE